MPLQRTRSRASLGRSPLNGGSLGCESHVQRCRDDASPAAEYGPGASATLGVHAPGAPRVPGPSPQSVVSGGASAGRILASMWPHPNMPLQRTHSRALLGRSPLNGGSLGGRALGT
jgi:hypothetical protein